jgi:hypothetical protein
MITLMIPTTLVNNSIKVLQEALEAKVATHMVVY